MCKAESPLQVFSEKMLLITKVIKYGNPQSQWSVKPWWPDKKFDSLWDQHNHEIYKLEKRQLPSNMGKYEIWLNMIEPNTLYLPVILADARARKWLQTAEQLRPAQYVYSDATEMAELLCRRKDITLH